MWLEYVSLRRKCGTRKEHVIFNALRDPQLPLRYSYSELIGHTRKTRTLVILSMASVLFIDEDKLICKLKECNSQIFSDR